MSRGRLLLLIALAAVAVELFALRPVLFDREGPIDDSQVMYGLIGCSFVAFGLVAWARRPDSRVGMLMTAAGFGFFVAPVVIQFEGPVAFLVSVLLLDPWPFFFVALLLSLLTRGRLQSRFDRLLVASYAVPMWVVPLALLLFLDLDGLNPLVAFPNAGVADALLNGQRGSHGSPSWVPRSSSSSRAGGPHPRRAAARCSRPSRARSRCCCSPRCSSTTSSARRARRY